MNLNHHQVFTDHWLELFPPCSKSAMLGDGAALCPPCPPFNRSAMISMLYNCGRTCQRCVKDVSRVCQLSRRCSGIELPSFEFGSCLGGETPSLGAFPGNCSHALLFCAPVLHRFCCEVIPMRGSSQNDTTISQ